MQKLGLCLVGSFFSLGLFCVKANAEVYSAGDKQRAITYGNITSTGMAQTEASNEPTVLGVIITGKPAGLLFKNLVKAKGVSSKDGCDITVGESLVCTRDHKVIVDGEPLNQCFTQFTSSGSFQGSDVTACRR